MKFIRTYEEFRFEDEDVQVLEPKKKSYLIDRPVDDTLLGGKEEDENSFIDSKGVIHIKNWKVY